MDDYNTNGGSPMNSPSAKSDVTPLIVGIGQHQSANDGHHCPEINARRPQTIGASQYSSLTTSNTPIHNNNCHEQQQHYRYSQEPKLQHDTESAYSCSNYAPIGTGSNSRYSTASQYSSQSRTSSNGSNAQTTIHVNSSHITVPVISGQQQQSKMIRTGPYGKESTTDLKNSASSSNLTTTSTTAENNDCYLLTAQPVRVDSSNGLSASNSSTANNLLHQQQQQQVECVNNDEIINVVTPTNKPMMSQSYDCNNLYQSLLTGSIHSAGGDTIGDIVWPSMHSSLVDHQSSYITNNHHQQQQQQQICASTIANNNTDSSSITTNCDTNSSSNTSTSGQVRHQVVAAQHLTEEGTHTHFCENLNLKILTIYLFFFTVRKLSLEKDVLNDTISKLREENQRLHLESQTASQQLRKLTEWFFNSNPNASTTTTTTTSSSTTVCEPSSSTNTNTITISIPQQQQPTTTSTSIPMTTTTTEQTNE